MDKNDKREGQKSNFIEKHSIIIIVILSLLAIAITTTIIILLITHKSSPSQPASTESESSEESSVTTDEELKAIYTSNDPAATATEYIPKYTEATESETISPDQKLEAYVALDYMYDSSNDLQARIANLKALLTLLDENPDHEGWDLLRENYNDILTELENE